MKFADLELELARVEEAAVAKGVEKGGQVTADQTRAASLVQVKSREIGLSPILSELDRLCLEYDSVRRAMPSGSQRTQAMTRILVRMRSLATSVVGNIDAYKSSGSAGNRLAAVAMMQMVPETVDLEWLAERFATEQPFIFYHAALALQNAMNHVPLSEEGRIRRVAETALETIAAFKGVPDDSTMMILQNIIDY